MPKEGNIRWGRVFGEGTFLGDKDDNFFGQPIKRRVEQMAWSHACPVREEVIGKYGEEWALRRYAECNFVFGLIIESAAGCNFPLYFRLLEPVNRVETENPSPNIKPKNVPPNFGMFMSPMSTPYGYALPRVLIEQFGRDDKRTGDRIFRGLKIVDRKVKIHTDPIGLLVSVGEAVIKADADSEAVVSHILSKGILEEEGCVTMFKKIMSQMKSRASLLWLTYQKMLSDKKWKNEIIRPEDLE